MGEACQQDQGQDGQEHAEYDSEGVGRQCVGEQSAHQRGHDGGPGHVHHDAIVYVADPSMGNAARRGIGQGDADSDPLGRVRVDQKESHQAGDYQAGPADAEQAAEEAGPKSKHG